MKAQLLYTVRKILVRRTKGQLQIEPRGSCTVANEAQLKTRLGRLHSETHDVRNALEYAEVTLYVTQIGMPRSITDTMK